MKRHGAALKNSVQLVFEKSTDLFIANGQHLRNMLITNDTFGIWKLNCRK